MAKTAKTANTNNADQKVDDKALSMRRAGKGYRSIAQSLGLGGASQANMAFNRAMRRLPEDEQQEVRSQEEGRLDRLAAATRANQSFSKDEVERRLGLIERLRARLHSD